MGLKFSNFGKALVGSAPSGTGGLSFTVEAGKGLLFPSLSTGDYFYGIFKDASGNREIVKVTARSSDAMTIAVGGRGQDGTTARTWAAGDYFVAGICNAALAETAGNANLTALGTLSTSADKLPYFTGSGAASLTDLSSFARTLIDDADASTMLSTLGFSTFAKTLIDDADAATARATLDAMSLTGNENVAGIKTFTSGAEIAGKLGSTTIATGYIGENQDVNVTSGSAISLTTGISKTIASRSLTAGKWDIGGIVNFNLAVNTQVWSLFGGSSLTTNTPDGYQYAHRCAPFVPGASPMGYAIPPRQIDIDVTTTVYLVATAGFTVSTCDAWGYMRIRRVA